MKTITKYAKQNRRKKTIYEKLLFNLLLKWKIHFRTQRMFDFYIVDFLIPDRWLIIEVDGGYHKNRVEYDLARDVYLRNKGFTVLHFDNEIVANNPNLVLLAINGIKDKKPPKDWRKLYGSSAY